MSMSIDEVHYQDFLSECHFNLVMKNEAKKQCIYIFVEGDSEELAFQPLLEGCGVDFEKHGIIVANYNGIGNLKHALRLFNKTLSHDRPVVVTFDDDIDGKRISNFIKGSLITSFKIPCTPVVTYNNGQKGGSFEECFPHEIFIESSFKPLAIDNKVLGKLAEFREIFDIHTPWVAQLAKFIKSNGGDPGSINKVKIAENMIASDAATPETFEKLASLIIKIRENHPIEHPNWVGLKI